MTSTQKLPKHHSYASSTQDSAAPGGSPGKPYSSGASVTKGGKPASGKGGVSVAAGPKSMGTAKSGKC